VTLNSLWYNINQWRYVDTVNYPGVTGTPGLILAQYGTPGSTHTGGCHFLMGDGTVRFVSQNINAQTLVNLGTISGSETIGEF
jgi:hypothetical protein